MADMHELRYVYRVEGSGKAFETVSFTRAFFYLGQLSQQSETASLTVNVLNVTTKELVSCGTLAHSLEGSLTELAHTPFTPVPA